MGRIGHIHGHTLCRPRQDGRCKKQFEGTKLLHGTEQAWQTYANAQAAHIADMGSSSERTRTARGIWSPFLMNISTVPDGHATAFQAYMGSKEEYDALLVQARITKLTLPSVADLHEE